MKGVHEGENIRKLKQLLPEFRSTLSENQEPVSFFIFHSSFFTTTTLLNV
jgi:hypothetical protein